LPELGDGNPTVFPIFPMTNLIAWHLLAWGGGRPLLAANPLAARRRIKINKERNMGRKKRKKCRQ